MFDWQLKRKMETIARRANPDRNFVRTLEVRLTKDLGLRKKIMTASRIIAGSSMSIALLLGGTAAYAYSSDSVLPDHPLYPVRQGLEKAEETLTLSAKNKAVVQLNHLKRRVHEQELLLKKGKTATPKQMEAFITNVKSTLEKTGGLSDSEKTELDDMAATIGSATSSPMVETEDEVLNTQTNLLNAHIERLQSRKTHAVKLKPAEKKIRLPPSVQKEGEATQKAD